VISIIDHNSGPRLVNVWHRESRGQAAYSRRRRKPKRGLTFSTHRQPMEVADETRLNAANKSHERCGLAHTETGSAVFLFSRRSQSYQARFTDWQRKPGSGPANCADSLWTISTLNADSCSSGKARGAAKSETLRNNHLSAFVELSAQGQKNSPTVRVFALRRLRGCLSAFERLT
jgi:hypothetical protein